MAIITFDDETRTIPTERGSARLATTDIIAGWAANAFRALAGAVTRKVESAKRRRWRRRAISELRGLSNRTLSDIGLDRSMIVSVVLEREAAQFGPAAE